MFNLSPVVFRRLLTAGAPGEPAQYRELAADDHDLWQRATWAARTLEDAGQAVSWYLRTRVIRYDPGVPDLVLPASTIFNVLGEIVFEGLIPGPLLPGPNGGLPLQRIVPDWSIDVFEMRDRPEAALVNLALNANLTLDISRLKFVDPDLELPPASDWQANNALIGPPLMSLPLSLGEVYSHKGGGEPLGTVWQAPSGRKYELRQFTQPFMRINYWWRMKEGS